MPSQISEFTSDRRGNFAIISGMLAVPLVLAVGLAIDASNIANTKSSAAASDRFGRAGCRPRG